MRAAPSHFKPTQRRSTSKPNDSAPRRGTGWSRFMKALSCALVRSEPQAVDASQNHQHSAPPHRRVEFGEHGIRRMRPFGKSSREDDHAVNQQQHSNKEPDRNDVVLFAHFIYQKIICRITRITSAAVPHTTGLCHQLACSSRANGVRL